MAYTVLARKYRPQSFEDLVGQEHVARTLGNAINSDRVAHAFLFTGVRGVGKTTTARLLAKALNCEKGPTPTPCNECGPCNEITAGVDVDVQEIDGASNNSVEDVRRLQESLPYRPQRDRYKIVIVDEVHMLSTGAFNAFLKTLEEPPDHVKFIFATTESHKVPVTIRSRCQQYDFRLIPHRLIGERVRAILDAEGLSADEEAISVVAREAAGSMRDALTLLDQLVAISDDRITADTVAASLGIAAREALYEVARAVLEGDGAAVVGAVDGLADKSVDMQHFARQLLHLMRDLVVLKLGAGDPAEWVPEEREAAEALIDDIDILELQRAFRATSRVMDEMAQSPNPKLMLEMGLVRVATRPPLQSVSELLARLEALQGTPGAKGGSSGGPRPRKPNPKRAPHPAKPKAEATPEAKPEPELKPQEPDQPIMPATKHSGGFHTSAGEVLTPIRRAALQEWEELVGTLEQQQPALAAVLEHGIPKAVGPDRIVLSFKDGSFYGRQAESPESIAAIVRIAEQQLGARPEIEIRFDAQGDAATKTVAAVAAQRKEAEVEAKRKEALNHPVVREAIDVFPEAAGKLKVHIEAD
ncbi:MAG: DNA polymerase III subunit gamma/tau [Deltaproteobacteria bacterium]|nr:DNA polymerase III subunit gamma/tau [Deltaproteobacteria bacterium]MBW2380173.1 DNA polymerase III subunit gamma/tau [Deltaproteobacteria bacterium]MBW2687139.1 DNA polymerase III subunit gamma/tau [Deltaproteobacteria bacterium]